MFKCLIITYSLKKSWIIFLKELNWLLLLAIVTKNILDIYDKYDGDFGLLDEPWASKKDGDMVSSEQAMLLSEYSDTLNFLKVDGVSEKMRLKALEKITELERFIDNEVIDVLKKRK